MATNPGLQAGVKRRECSMGFSPNEMLQMFYAQ
jgi:hypothetical protein